jgi:hypothetical protein
VQSVPDSWTHWVYTNAPAAWLSALVATIGCLILIRRRIRPRRLVIRELGTSSLVRVWPGVRQKIKISFDDRPITILGQIDYEVFNEGSDVIQNSDFTLTFPAESIVLDVLLTPEDVAAELKIEANKVTVRLPYINPVREHRQRLTLSILVDGNPAKVGIVGSGAGWLSGINVYHPPSETFSLT